MKKWILFLVTFLSVLSARAYSEQALHEDALDSESFVDESLFDHEYYLNQDGPLPLPDDPVPPG